MEIVTEGSDLFSFQAIEPRICLVLRQELERIKDWSVSTTGSAPEKRWFLPDYRNSSQIRVQSVGEILLHYRKTVDKIIKRVAELCWEHPYLSDHDDALLIRYPPGGLFKRHIDYAPGAVAKVRVLSFVCYLNDDFTGGRTTFPRQKCSIQPATGRAILFPAGITHPHLAEEVLAGTKYVLVGWLS